jgi:hypothetical protein
MNKTEALVAILEKARLHDVLGGSSQEAYALLVNTLEVFGQRTSALSRDDIVLLGGLAVLCLADDDSDAPAERTLSEWLSASGAKMGPLRGSRP